MVVRSVARYAGSFPSPLLFPRLKPGSTPCSPLRGRKTIAPGFSRGKATGTENEPA